MDKKNSWRLVKLLGATAFIIGTAYTCARKQHQDAFKENSVATTQSIQPAVKPNAVINVPKAK